MSILTRMLQRRGTSLQWVASTVLASGEIGIETDTQKFKIGDGITTWANLSYFVPLSLSLSTANIFSNTQTFTPSVTTGIPLITKGLPSQTADLQQWQDSNGTPLSAISYNGVASFKDIFVGQVNSSWRIIVTNGQNNLIPLIVKAAAFQTASLTEWQDSLGTTVLAKVDSAGSITAKDLTLSGNLTVNGTTTTISTSNLEVTDSLIYLASTQYTTDNLDIGFYGAYSPTGIGHVHTGLVRNSTSKVWNLISGGAEPSNSTVSLIGVTYDSLKVGSIQVTDGSTTRTNIGATTVGSNLFTLTNPSAITFLRINADNTVSTLDAATFRTAIGAGSGNSSGTVTSVSVASANGFAGTVATATSTPAITLTTSVTGVLKGNGTAIIAATAGTDYLAPITGTVVFGSNTITGLGTAITGAAGNNLTITSATSGNGNLTLISAGTGTANLNTQAVTSTLTTTAAINIKTGNSTNLITSSGASTGNIVIKTGDALDSDGTFSSSATAGSITIDSGSASSGNSAFVGSISIGSTNAQSITVGNVNSTTTLNGKIAATTLAAGTTTVAPLKFTSGTNLTTPLAGAVEYDGLVQYFTPATGATATTNGGRAIVQTSHNYVIHTAATAITNGTAAQKLLQGLATNGGISLTVGTYEVEFLFTLSNSGASTTSHTIAFNMLGTGSTATTTASHLYAQAYMFQLGNTNSSTPNMSAWTSMNTSTVLTSATTTKDQTFLIKGTMNISGAGLVVPNITFSAAPGNTTTLVIGSYFKFTPIMSNTNTTGIGAWS